MFICVVGQKMSPPHNRLELRVNINNGINRYWIRTLQKFLKVFWPLFYELEKASTFFPHLSLPSTFLLIPFYFILFIFFCFLGPYPRHLEVPRLGVESELQLPASTTATEMRDPSHVCDLRHSSRQHRILNPLSKARDWTHILVDTSGFVSTVPQWELPTFYF